MKIGIVALSFGKVDRRTAVDPVNNTLSSYVREANNQITTWSLTSRGDTRHSGYTETLVVAQHEVAAYLSGDPELNLRIVTDAHATRKGSGRIYLDSQDVLNEAFRIFRKEDIYEVIVIAHPFLHSWMVRRLVQQAGFIIHPFKVGRDVNFDSSRNNLQWWCRGRVRFLLYLMIQMAGRVIGKDFHGIGERHGTLA